MQSECPISMRSLIFFTTAVCCPILLSIYLQYSDPEEAEIDFPLHPYKVGDLVIMKWWSDDSTQPKWKGPYKVTAITFSSLKMDEVKEWVYHSDVRRYVPPPPEEEKKESEWSVELVDPVNNLKLLFKRIK